MRHALLLLFLALATGCTGCASMIFRERVDIREFALRLELGSSICSGVAIGPNELQTATHCFSSGPLRTVNGKAVTVVRVYDDRRDHSIVTIAEPLFEKWAKRGPAMKAGDRVRWWGNPNGEAFVYRQGYVSKVADGYVLLDATICHGDSGAGLFNDDDELVGSVTGMTNEAGCTFMGVMR